ncbi:MAG: response regulator [Planctomycetota bacterium]
MTATGKRVLVVDDEDVVCRSYERVLTKAGFDVAKAHNGTEALDRVRDAKFDVMLADLMMPGMNGLQVIEHVRGTNPEVPVVVITGYPSQATLQQVARLGVADYLTKPVAPDVLVQATLQAMAAAPWGRSMSTPHGATRKVEDQPFAGELPPGLLYWPEKPAAAIPLPATAKVTAPVPAECAPEVVPVATPAVATPQAVPAPAPAVAPAGVLRTAAALVLAPVVSLAYVLFLPLLGLGMFAALAGKALLKKVGGLG